MRKPPSKLHSFTGIVLGKRRITNYPIKVHQFTAFPQDEDEDKAKSWQASLLRQSSSVPFPVGFETNEDLRWSKNQKGRLCVEFYGLSEYTFEVYCDKDNSTGFNAS
jgi:hypothetical protein